MTNIDPQEKINEMISIPSQRNYWLVRSMGGDYFREYYKKMFVAIGYDKIFLKDIKYVRTFGTEAQRKLTEIITERYVNDKNINPSYAASQLLKFSLDIKVGDIVIVPGKSYNRHIALGIVNSNVYEEKGPLESSEREEICPFTKRIDVKWIKADYRNALNPQMQLMFNSRHIVSNVTHYAEYIDSTTNDFYGKDDNTYLVLRVKTKQDISGSDFLFVGDIFQLVNEYFEEKKINIKAEDVVKIKACVQSPGDIIMFAKENSGLVMFAIGALILLINGGGLKISSIGVDLSTPGLLKSVSEFLDRKRDRKLQEAAEKKLRSLEIKNPEDLLNVIKALKNPRTEY